MPVPKRRTSRARRDQRAAGKKAVILNYALCPTCGAPVSGHHVCKECGHYKGVKVLRTKTDRLYARNKERQTVQAQKQPQADVAPEAESAAK